MLAVILVPVLVVQAPSMPHAALPDAVEVRPGLWVLQTGATEATFKSLKSLGITHVLNLRSDAEGDFTAQGAAAKAQGADYGRCPMDREPSDAALDAFRARLKALPKGARVLLHCASGNRVGGALFTAWVLDEGLADSDALTLAKKAGLRNPATEAAAQAYVARKRGSK